MHCKASFVSFILQYVSIHWFGLLDVATLCAIIQCSPIRCQRMKQWIANSVCRGNLDCHKSTATAFTELCVQNRFSETKWFFILQASASWEKPTKETALMPPVRRKVRRSDIILQLISHSDAGWSQCFLLWRAEQQSGQKNFTRACLISEWGLIVRTAHRQSKERLTTQSRSHSLGYIGNTKSELVFIFGGRLEKAECVSNPHISRLYLPDDVLDCVQRGQQ